MVDSIIQLSPKVHEKSKEKSVGKKLNTKAAAAHSNEVMAQKAESNSKIQWTWKKKETAFPSSRFRHTYFETLVLNTTAALEDLLADPISSDVIRK